MYFAFQLFTLRAQIIVLIMMMTMIVTMIMMMTMITKRPGVLCARVVHPESSDLAASAQGRHMPPASLAPTCVGKKHLVINIMMISSTLRCNDFYDEEEDNGDLFLLVTSVDIMIIIF